MIAIQRSTILVLFALVLAGGVEAGKRTVRLREKPSRKLLTVGEIVELCCLEGTEYREYKECAKNAMDFLDEEEKDALLEAGVSKQCGYKEHLEERLKKETGAMRSEGGEPSSYDSVDESGEGVEGAEDSTAASAENSTDELKKLKGDLEDDLEEAADADDSLSSCEDKLIALQDEMAEMEEGTARHREADKALEKQLLECKKFHDYKLKKEEEAMEVENEIEEIEGEYTRN